MDINPELIRILSALKPSSQGCPQSEESMVISQGPNVVSIQPDQSHGISGTKEPVVVPPQGSSAAATEPQTSDVNQKKKGKMVAAALPQPIQPQNLMVTKTMIQPPRSDVVQTAPQFFRRPFVRRNRDRKVTWTDERPRRFLAAVDSLGGPFAARPKKLLEILRRQRFDYDQVKTLLMRCRYDIKKQERLLKRAKGEDTSDQDANSTTSAYNEPTLSTSLTAPDNQPESPNSLIISITNLVRPKTAAPPAPSDEATSQVQASTGANPATLLPSGVSSSIADSKGKSLQQSGTSMPYKVANFQQPFHDENLAIFLSDGTNSSNSPMEIDGIGFSSSQTSAAASFYGNVSLASPVPASTTENSIPSLLAVCSSMPSMPAYPQPNSTVQPLGNINASAPSSMGACNVDYCPVSALDNINSGANSNTWWDGFIVSRPASPKEHYNGAEVSLSPFSIGSSISPMTSFNAAVSFHDTTWSSKPPVANLAPVTSFNDPNSAVSFHDTTWSSKPPVANLAPVTSFNEPNSAVSFYDTWSSNPPLANSGVTSFNVPNAAITFHDSFWSSKPPTANSAPAVNNMGSFVPPGVSVNVANSFAPLPAASFNQENSLEPFPSYSHYSRPIGTSYDYNQGTLNGREENNAGMNAGNGNFIKHSTDDSLGQYMGLLGQATFPMDDLPEFGIGSYSWFNDSDIKPF